MIILENIKRVRESKKLSQTEVAEQIGIAYQNYWKIENGKTELSITRLYEIAKILGVGVSELLGEGTKVEGNSEEVASLKKRVAELEDRIRDKYRIIKTIESRLDISVDRVLSFLNDLLISTSDKYEIGTLKYYELKTKKPLTTSVNTGVIMLGVIKELESTGLSLFHDIGIDYVFSEEEKGEIYENMFSDNEYKKIWNIFVDSDLAEDTDDAIIITNAYKRYKRKEESKKLNSSK